MTSYTQWHQAPADLPIAALQRLADLLGVSLEDLVALLRARKLEYRLPRPGKVMVRHRGRIVEWQVTDEEVLLRLRLRRRVRAQQAARWSSPFEEDQAGDDLGPEL